MDSSQQGFEGAPVGRWATAVVKSTTEFAVIVLSADGLIQAWMGAAPLLFGYEAEELVGRPLSTIFTPEDVQAGLELQERQLALAAGRSEDDRWHVRKDGSRFWASGVIETIREDGQVVALAKVLRDRTDIRTQTVTLQNRLTAAEELNTRRLQAIATVAHELRNQVSPLSNLLAVIEKAGAAPDVSSSMRRQIAGLARLVNDLVEESSSAAAQPTLVFAQLEVQARVRHAAQAIASQMRPRKQVLKVTVPDQPIFIEADGQRVDQMLFNLLSNASKFTPKGGVLQLSATIEDDMVAIRVEDDGDGIPADVLPKIFELFTREGRAGAPRGLGVGLAVVKGLVEQHGGIIEGRSPGVGKGSIFTIRLPLTQGNPASPPSKN